MTQLGTTVTVDTLSKKEWSELLSQFGDSSLYQTWQYGHVRWGDANISRLVVLGPDGAPISAAQVRILRIPLLNVGMAYVRYGPMWRVRGKDADVANFRAGLRALIDEYAKARGLFLRVVPFGYEETDGAMKDALVAQGFEATRGIYRDPRRTVLIDLSPSDDVLRQKLRKNWRYDLREAERHSLQLREDFATDFFPSLNTLFTEMVDRKKFKAGSDVAEFARIQELLDAELKLRVSVGSASGDVVSGFVCDGIGDTCIGLTSATGPAGRQVKASYLLQWDQILWCKRMGKRTLDLNGTNKATNPGVYHFKTGIGGSEVKFLEVYDFCASAFLYRAVLAFENAVRLRSKVSSWRLPSPQKVRRPTAVEGAR